MKALIKIGITLSAILILGVAQANDKRLRVSIQGIDEVGFHFYAFDESGAAVETSCIDNKCVTNGNGIVDIYFSNSAVDVSISFDRDVFPVFHPFPADPKIPLSKVELAEIDGESVPVIHCVPSRNARSIRVGSANQSWAALLPTDSTWGNAENRQFLAVLAGAYATTGKVQFAQKLIREDVDLRLLTSHQADYLMGLANEDVQRVQELEIVTESIIDSEIRASESSGTLPNYERIISKVDEARVQIGVSKMVALDAYFGATVREDLLRNRTSFVGDGKAVAVVLGEQEMSFSREALSVYDDLMNEHNLSRNSSIDSVWAIGASHSVESSDIHGGVALTPSLQSAMSVGGVELEIRE